MARGKGIQPPVARNRRNPAGRRRKAAPDDPGFGWDPGAEPIPPMVASEIVIGEQPSAPAPELLALGLPPADAAGIQKWHYQALSTMAALVLRSDSISEETRLKRFGALTLAAARHYPEAAKYDLAQQIARDAAEVMGKKRAKAAAKLEKAIPVAGGAKVIPIRSEA